MFSVWFDKIGILNVVRFENVQNGDYINEVFFSLTLLIKQRWCLKIKLKSNCVKKHIYIYREREREPKTENNKFEKKYFKCFNSKSWQKIKIM